MRFNLSEIFYSIQGEGPDCGFPSIFIRFSGCNLRCMWGKNCCDTPFTSWTQENNWIKVEDLIEGIKSVSDKHKCKYLVITGGEPTIQPAFDYLTKELAAQGFSVALETNGTREFDTKDFSLVVVSPKLSDSVPVGTVFEKMHQSNRKIKRLSGNNVHYKFVVSTKTDMQEIEDMIKEYEISNDHVWLMPEGVTRKEILDNQEFVVEMCKIKGYKFSSRLHILLWDKKRGV